LQTRWDPNFKTFIKNIFIKNNGVLDMRGDSRINFSGSPRYIYVESGGELRQANTAGINK